MFLKLISFQWEEESEHFIQFGKYYNSPIHIGANWDLKIDFWPAKSRPKFPRFTNK